MIQLKSDNFQYKIPLECMTFRYKRLLNLLLQMRIILKCLKPSWYTPKPYVLKIDSMIRVAFLFFYLGHLPQIQRNTLFIWWIQLSTELVFAFPHILCSRHAFCVTHLKQWKCTFLRNTLKWTATAILPVPFKVKRFASSYSSSKTHSIQAGDLYIFRY